jgi:hypothetical protein
LLTWWPQLWQMKMVFAPAPFTLHPLGMSGAL